MTLVHLTDEALGATVVDASDDFFAPKEGLLRAADPVFKPGAFTEHGKWMDGWETRRLRGPGHDWAIVRLGMPGVLREVLVDTTHFKGNAPEACSLEGALVDDEALDDIEWRELLPRTPVKADSHNPFSLGGDYVSHVRLHIYPDGGVARLRIHGEPLCAWPRLQAEPEPDVAALTAGSTIVDCSDCFFGAPDNLLYPGRSLGMWDGWETRRRRDAGHDWVIVRLGGTAVVRAIEVDTSHFKGNFPESCALDGSATGHDWQELVARRPLQADHTHRFDQVASLGAVRFVRLRIFPDGGVARLRVFGHWSDEGRETLLVHYLNALPDDAARRWLASCTGSKRWLDSMVRSRPFASFADCKRIASEHWDAGDEADWREAIAAHPRIGEREGRADQTQRARRWSQAEQEGVSDASTATLDRLTAANRAYESRFGHTFVVCATGKSAEEMLALLEARMAHSPEEELRVAAQEERKIMLLRMQKLVHP